MVKWSGIAPAHTAPKYTSAGAGASSNWANMHTIRFAIDEARDRQRGAMQRTIEGMARLDHNPVFANSQRRAAR